MKIDKNIFKSLALISQIGISMLVPIFLCTFVGTKLDAWLLTNYFTIVFLFLGICAAFRNVFHLTKSFYTKEKLKEDYLANNNMKSNHLTKENRNAELVEEYNKWVNENQKKS